RHARVLVAGNEAVQVGTTLFPASLWRLAPRPAWYSLEAGCAFVRQRALLVRGALNVDPVTQSIAVLAMILRDARMTLSRRKTFEEFVAGLPSGLVAMPIPTGECFETSCSLLREVAPMPARSLMRSPCTEPIALLRMAEGNLRMALTSYEPL